MKHKLKLRLKDVRLRTKFLISFVLVIFVSLSLNSFLNYYTSTNSIKKMTSDNSTLLLDQIALNFERRIAEIEDLSFQEYTKSDFCRLIADEGEINQLEQFMLVQSVREFLYRMVYAYDPVAYANVHTTTGMHHTQFRHDVTDHPLLQKVEFSESELNQLNEKRGQTVWEHGDTNLIFMKRAMYDVQTSSYCGALVIAVDTSYFQSIYPHTDTSGEIMFTNEQGKLLIYNDRTSAELFEASQEASASEFFLDSSRYIFTEHDTSDNRWRLFNIVSFDQFTAPMKAIRYWVLITFCIAFVIAFINAALLSNYITKRLNVLVSSMKTLSVGVMDTYIRTDAKDEIGLIADKFNIMVAKIKELIHRVSQERLQKEQAEYRQLEFEYKALQAQMNPHFLYNTLESIHSLAKIKGQHDIGKMIYLLGRLMRESISRKQDFIELREEIDFIKDYLMLQSITYESRLQVEYEIEEEAQSWTVPRFILQPILENAIVHGIEEKPGVGIIKIRCYEAGDDLVLEVEDNGVGMSQDTIERLLASDETAQQEDKPNHTSVGIRSVHKRLQIGYGSRYGIKIQSELGLGTTIMIRLPKKGKEDVIVDHESRSHRR